MARKPKGKRPPVGQHTTEPSSTQTNNQQQDKNVSLQMVAREQFFEGPLPPPAILEGYEKILPGSADRVITMAEAVSSHAQKVEMEVIAAKRQEVLLGQIFGLCIGLPHLLPLRIVLI